MKSWLVGMCRRRVINLIWLGALATWNAGLIPAHGQGAVDGFNPNANGRVRAVAFQADGKIIIGGDFTTIGGVTRQGIARLNSNGTLDATFVDPQAGGEVLTLLVLADQKILVGGGFTTMGGQSRRHLARLNSNGSLDATFTIDPNDWIRDLALTPDGKILIAGRFTSLSGTQINRLARLNSNGTLDNSFNPGASGQINALLVEPGGKIWVGGFFTNLAGQACNRIGRLTSGGVLDAAFLPGANNPVWKFARQDDNKILATGDFTSLLGQTRVRIARINTDNTLDNSFSPEADSTVNSIVVQPDARIVVGGNFSNLAGQPRSYIARLHPHGGLDTSFNPEANNTLYGLALQGNGLILAMGDFTQLGGQTRNHMARLDSVGPFITSQPLDRSAPLGTQTTFTVIAGGTAPLSYQWRKDGADIGGATSPSFTIPAIQPEDAGVYTVEVSNSIGAVLSDNAILLLGAPPPANDLFANRIVLNGTSNTVTGINLGAGKEANEPQHAGNAGGRSVWWSWTAPASGLVAVSTKGSSFDTLLAVYTGNAVNTLTKVASNDQYPDLADASRLFFQAQAGVAYRIAVDGYSAFSPAAGNIRLTVEMVPAAPNANFNQRALLTGSAATLQVVFPGGDPLWYSWTAPSSGQAQIHVGLARFPEFAEQGPNATVAIYTGPNQAALNTVVATSEGRAVFNAIPNVTYHFAVAGYDSGFFNPLPAGEVGDLNLTLELVPTPPIIKPFNDDFADRASIVGSNAIVSSSHLGATYEPGESEDCCEGSVWWSWTAPFTGGVQLDSIPDQTKSFDVYTGNSLAALQPVAPSSFGPLVFFATSGVTYQIQVQGQVNHFDMTLLTQPPAPNDAFANRLALTGTDATAVAQVGGASRQTGEPDHFGEPARQSVWWSWTAPSSGTVSLFDNRYNAEDLNFSETPGFTVYTGNSLGTLTRVADEFGSLYFQAVAQTTYQIVVDTISPIFGSIPIRLLLYSAPPNDHLANSIPLAGRSVTATGSNVGATRQSGEPDHAFFSDGKSVWWSWTPPLSGPAQVNTAGSRIETVLGVYTGNSYPLNLVADSSFGELEFDAQAGVTYRIAVDLQEFSFPWDLGGPIVLNASVGAPANDHFAQREILPADVRAFGGSNRLATREAGEPPHANFEVDSSIWWSWNAPATGLVTISLLTNNFNQILSVYTGDALPTLTRLNQGVTAITFPVQASVSYHIVVGSSNGEGETLLKLNHHPTVAITAPGPGTQFPTGSTVALNVAGTDRDGTLTDVELFIDDQGVAKGAGPSLVFQWGPTNRGKYAITATARDNDGTEGGSSRVNLFRGAYLGIVDAPAFESLTNQDQTITFSGPVRIANWRSASSRPLRLRLIAQAGYSYVGFEGPPEIIEPDHDMGIFPLPGDGMVPPSSIVSAPISGRVPAPVPTAEMHYAFGWGVIAILEENYDGIWLVQDRELVLYGVWPFLRQTGPGGGVIRIEPIFSAGGFFPIQVKSGTLFGPSTLLEGRSASYSGTLFFDDNKTTLIFTNTVWESSRFTINSGGLFKSGIVTADTPVTITAHYDYNGNTNIVSRQVTVLNLPPPLLTNLSHLGWTIQGVPAREHVIETSSTVADPSSWQPIFTNRLDGQGLWQWLYDPAPDGLPHFFRAREQ